MTRLMIQFVCFCNFFMLSIC